MTIYKCPRLIRKVLKEHPQGLTIHGLVAEILKIRILTKSNIQIRLTKMVRSGEVAKETKVCPTCARPTTIYKATRVVRDATETAIPYEFT